MNKCKQCLEHKPIAQFCNTEKRIVYTICHDCRNQGRKRRNRAANRKDNTKNNTTQKELRIEYLVKLGSKCTRCGYNEFNSALEFHHLVPAGKEFEISVLFIKYANNPSEENRAVLENEISKCVILCSNCHNALHKKEWNYI